MGLDPTWLTAFLVTTVVELVTFASFFPAFMNDWRLWTNVRWDLESPYMYPPFFVNGPLWFVLQLLNGLAFAWLVSAEVSHLYHAVCALWVIALFFWAFWAIPWQIQNVNWTLGIWTLSLVFSIASCICAWILEERSVAGPILLTIYCAFLLLIVLFNLFVLVARVLSNTSPDVVLHRRRSCVFAVWCRNGLWPPLPVTSSVAPSRKWLAGQASSS